MMRLLLIIFLLFSLTASARDTCFVKGRIMSKGQGVPGVVVAAVYHHSLLGYAISDSSGYYSLNITHHQKRTLDGNSQVRIQYMKAGYDMHTVKQQAKKYSNEKDLDVKLSEDRPSSPAQGVKGKVADSKTKLPIEGVVLLLWYGENLISAGVTDAEGMYSIKAEKGAYTMSAKAHGYSDNQQGMGIGDTIVSINIEMKPRSKTIKLVDPHEK